MRAEADDARIRALLAALGRAARIPGRLYLTGGATAVLEGWRPSTVDVDLRLEPESDELFHAIARLKDELGVNVELVSPPDFIPELPGWRERSPFVTQEGLLAVHHFDPYSQALSKIERGLDRDTADVRAMIDRGDVERARLRALFAQVEPQLIRYPAIDPATLARKLERWVGPA